MTTSGTWSTPAISTAIAAMVSRVEAPSATSLASLAAMPCRRVKARSPAMTVLPPTMTAASCANSARSPSASGGNGVWPLGSAHIVPQTATPTRMATHTPGRSSGCRLTATRSAPRRSAAALSTADTRASSVAPVATIARMCRMASLTAACRRSSRYVGVHLPTTISPTRYSAQATRAEIASGCTLSDYLYPLAQAPRAPSDLMRIVRPGRCGPGCH